MLSALRWLLCGCLVIGLPVAAACPPADQDREGLLRLRAAGFDVAGDAARQSLALGLLGCLGDADPALRDGVAYEGLSHWLRAGKIDGATREALRLQLQAMLAAEGDDSDGLRPPFAALVLSEVARTDRVSPWLEPAQRASLVDAAASYLAGVRDYRGFDPGQGWRHGVAHGADLAMQLALNPALDRPQLDSLLDAVARQVAPPRAPPYVHGESERLVRPVVFALQRGFHDPGEWARWLEKVSAPSPHSDWAQAYLSAEGLAKRHNTRAFLLALHLALRESGSEPLQAYVPAVVAALQATG
ncbi:MAG: DUF2785 domain-containing protein [Arenimonas sp.]|nr:DUF2785 domain-containing protein [Arenimonas sp.]